MNNQSLGLRLNDCFNLPFTQDDVDFAIPFLEEDIPLFLDPFLLWSSENPVYNQLHDHLMNFFEDVRRSIKNDREGEALHLLLGCSEPTELGLGYSSNSKRGSTIGPKLARDIVAMYNFVPQVNEHGLNHIEEIQLVVPNISNDRISDVVYSILKGYFIKFTFNNAVKHNIPTKKYMIDKLYNFTKSRWGAGIQVSLPYSPINNAPIVFAPVDMLRHLPWINYRDFYNSYYSKVVLPPDKTKGKLGRAIHVDKEVVLLANRANFAHVRNYVEIKEKAAADCKPDPFTEASILQNAMRRANRAAMIIEQQIAGFTSLHVPTHLLIELEDKKAEIARLEARLDTARSNKTA